MKLVLSALVLFTMLVIVAMLWLRKLVGAKAPTPVYTKADALFTAAEREFLAALDAAVGGQYRVFGKVRVVDLLSVRPGLSASERQTALNRIQSKHVDFVVCDRKSLAVVCAVELNDASHRRSRRRERDAFLAEAFQAAGLPLVSVPARSHYNAQEVAAQLAAALAPQNAPASGA